MCQSASLCPNMAMILRLTVIVILVTQAFCRSWCGAAEDNQRSLLVFDGRDVIRLDIDLNGHEVHPTTVIENVAFFRALPSGRFLYCDTYFPVKPGGHWFVGDIMKPVDATEIRPPTREGEKLTTAVLSHLGDRVAWTTHRRGERGAVIVTTILGGKTVKVIERPAIGTGETFGTPAWSPDDKSLTFFYLRSSRIEEDQQKLVQLLVADLSVEPPQTTDVLPTPFVSNDMHVPQWSPDGKRLMFSKAEASEFQGGFDRKFIAARNGADLHLAKGEIFLGSDRFEIVDQRVDGPPKNGWVHELATARDLQTMNSVPLDFTLPEDVMFQAWSDDSFFIALGLRRPRAGLPTRFDDNAAVLTLIDTRTGEKRELLRVSNDVQTDGVFWLRK